MITYLHLNSHQNLAFSYAFMKRMKTSKHPKFCSACTNITMAHSMGGDGIDFGYGVDV